MATFTLQPRPGPRTPENGGARHSPFFDTLWGPPATRHRHGPNFGIGRIRSAYRAGAEDDPKVMKRVVVLLATTVLVCGGLSALGPGSGTARADDYCSPPTQVDGKCYGPNHWCPGDSLFHLTQNHIAQPVTWDMNICHTWYIVTPGMGNSGGMNDGIWDGPNPPPPQAPPPPPPPGLDFCPIPPWCP
jgi:hypothetical protein